MENYVGKRLDGRYEIQEIIGVGGMSVVYKAYDNVDDRIVAVKILKDEFAGDAEFVRRFKNESKAIAVLSHPNIVKVYDVSFGEKLQYIVMEYVDGITLKEYILKQKLITWNDAVFFTTQILKALQHAHDKGIVHRDIKPQNIMLLSTGNIKVTDFGIARFSRTETKTLTENAIGSVHYISPEQAKGEFTDERADIYSLGVVFYEMLAGDVPFEAESAVSVALMQLQKDPKKLTEINPDIPLGIEQICIHAMQKNPDDRYQTATEMLLDLEAVIRNPKATFDYTYFVDKEPTKYVISEGIAGTVTDNESSEEDFDNEYEEYIDPNRKKKITFAIILGVIVLACAIVGLVRFITQGLNTDTAVLENFEGQMYDDLVSNKSYEYEFIAEYKQSDEVPPGTVISQSPSAGEKVIAGSKVTLIVSSSTEDLIVPNCYGLTLEKAEKMLANSNLNVYKTAEVSSETMEPGSVVYTDPKAGSVVSANREITIFISSGPSTTTLKTYAVPDVRGLSQSDAKKFLAAAGLSNVVFETKDDSTRKGIVLSQSPSAGSTVKENEKIVVTVSTGITTTESTTSDQYTIDITVKLPICRDGNNYPKDTVIITVDGKQYTTKRVSLDGSSVNFAVPSDSGKEIKINVSISELGASQDFVINVNQDKSKTVDFTSYSDSSEE